MPPSGFCLLGQKPGGNPNQSWFYNWSISIWNRSAHVKDSGMREIFACRIRNLEKFCLWIRNTAEEIPNPSNNLNQRNPEKGLESSNWNPKSTVWNPKSKTVFDWSHIWGETEFRTACCDDRLCPSRQKLGKYALREFERPRRVNNKAEN